MIYLGEFHFYHTPKAFWLLLHCVLRIIIKNPIKLYKSFKRFYYIMQLINKQIFLLINIHNLNWT
ncbi:hypothetical protein NUSPORA_00999 [Nucleospora cyclopteri]